jgi:hypothetical protein
VPGAERPGHRRDAEGGSRRLGPEAGTPGGSLAAVARTPSAFLIGPLFLGKGSPPFPPNAVTSWGLGLVSTFSPRTLPRLGFCTAEAVRPWRAPAPLLLWGPLAGLGRELLSVPTGAGPAWGEVGPSLHLQGPRGVSTPRPSTPPTPGAPGCCPELRPGEAGRGAAAPAPAPSRPHVPPPTLSETPAPRPLLLKCDRDRDKPLAAELARSLALFPPSWVTKFTLSAR